MCFCLKGETNLSPLIATLCGRQLPGSLHTTGDAMFLRFTSDSSVSRGGFNASYSKGEYFKSITKSSQNAEMQIFYPNFSIRLWRFHPYGQRSSELSSLSTELQAQPKLQLANHGHSRVQSVPNLRKPFPDTRIWSAV